MRHQVPMSLTESLLDWYDTHARDLPWRGNPTAYEVLLSEEPYRTSIVSADFGGDLDIIFDVFGVPDSGGSVVISVGNRVRNVTVQAVTGRASAQ